MSAGIDAEKFRSSLQRRNENQGLSVVLVAQVTRSPVEPEDHAKLQFPGVRADHARDRAAPLPTPHEFSPHLPSQAWPARTPRAVTSFVAAPSVMNVSARVQTTMLLRLECGHAKHQPHRSFPDRHAFPGGLVFLPGVDLNCRAQRTLRAGPYRQSPD